MKGDRKKFDKSSKKQTEQKSELDSFGDKGAKSWSLLIFWLFFPSSHQYDIYEDSNPHILPFKNIDALITV